MTSENLKIGKKTARMQFNVTARFEEVFNKQLELRKKRDPKDPTKLIAFRNQTDFFETIFKAVFLMGKFDYNFWMMLNNPEHPDFPEEHI